MDRPRRLSRGYSTWLLYVVFSSMAFLLNGMGAVLAPLQKELGVTRGQVAFYPSLFALGLLVVGLAGGQFVGRIGRAAALRLSVAGMMLGGLLIAAPSRVTTLLGALSLGLGAALLIQLVPALLAAMQPRAPAATIGEANGLASAASVLAPLAVAAALAAGLGWRAGYLVAPLVALAALTLPVWRLVLPNAPSSITASQSSTAAPMLGRWVDLLLSVSVEFCFVFWAASAVITWDHASLSQAPAVAALFLVGMATARALSARIIRRIHEPRVLVLACTAIAAAGFVLFWAAPTLALAGAGLLLAGLGVALLYPTTVSRVVAAWPQAPDRAAARAALASGIAIGGAPFLLAQLSDAIGLRSAFLIVPALLVILAIRVGSNRIRHWGELDHHRRLTWRATIRSELLRDYRSWHEQYDDPTSPLAERLRIVQHRLGELLSAAPAGPIRLISMCAGQGRDVIGVLPGHERRSDVRGVLVELDPANVSLAREAATDAGLTSLEVIEGDASKSDIYESFVPADVVLACGIFGNVSGADVENTVRTLSMLCNRGAAVIWTRHRREPDLNREIRRWLVESGFEELSFDAPDNASLSGIGTMRLGAAPAPWRRGHRFFTFVR